MQTEKKWGRGVLILALAALLLLGGFTALVDPAFHYHKPLEMLDYYIFSQRYQNDGIVKNFDYDAIITGTSMTENFRASELDALFGVSSVKVPFSGTSMREVADNLRRAFKANDGIKMVVLGLDGSNFGDDKDVLRSDVPLPLYLYDENILNDVSYLLNKDILLKYTMRMLQHTYYRVGTTSFDDYSFWWDNFEHGSRVVLDGYSRTDTQTEQTAMSDSYAQRLRENIQQNVVQLAQENPDTVFYCYFSPYCTMAWDMLYLSGGLEERIDAYRLVTEELLECENIRLYSFSTRYEWTEDLESYKDIYHHSPEINSGILQQMLHDEDLLTKENYEEHWQTVLERYLNFDYESYYRQYGWPFP